MMGKLMGKLKVGNLINSTVDNLMVGKLGSFCKLVMGEKQETNVSHQPTASSVSAHLKYL